MIHLSNEATNNKVVTVYERVQAEIVSAPKPLPMPFVERPVLGKASRSRWHSQSTLFEGNKGVKLHLWDDLGTDVSTASSAMEVCKLAGLAYTVKTEPIYTMDGIKVPNMVVTRRYDYDPVTDTEIASTVYGAVTDRYHPVQNYYGFDFIDTLFHHDGFEVETAGQFNDGKIVWVEARMPERNLSGERIDPFLVFTNRHDGKGSVRIFLTPVRIICKNTLNAAIKGAQDRSFAVTHTANAALKLEQAKQAIQNYNDYLDAMEKQIAIQKQLLLTDDHVENLLTQIFILKEGDNATDRKKEKVLRERQEVRDIYYNTPDLDGYEKSAFRFVNAVSDWATHHTPSRQTKDYRSNLFQKTLNGNEYIDKAYALINEFAPVANKMIAMS